MDQHTVVKAQLMDGRDLDRTLDRMARQIVETFSDEEGNLPAIGLVGMQRRGVPIAQRPASRGVGPKMRRFGPSPCGSAQQSGANGAVLAPRSTGHLKS